MLRKGLDDRAGGGLAASPGPLLANRRRLSAIGWRRPWLRPLGLLIPPLGWFGVFYLASLAVLFLSAFWGLDSFTGKLNHVWQLTNFRTLWDDPTYRHIAWHTLWMASVVTITDAVLAVPFGYFMARVAPARLRGVLFVLILLPLWSSYLARIYAWRLILAHDGALNWTLGKAGLPSLGLAYTDWAMWLVFSYVWLPFMILPVYAAMERIPDSYLEASADLGARGWRTTRTVILPLALPGIVAGSIFTFSLTLGDYITPLLVGNSQFIGTVIYRNALGLTNNLPFAAAYAMVPLVIMGVYLSVAKRLGAFEAL